MLPTSALTYADAKHLKEAHTAFLAAQDAIGFFAIDDILIVASPGVYHPANGSSTLFMLQNLPMFEGCKLLEIGAGTGAIGLYYGRRGNDVTLCDIDLEAVRCATFNTLINHVDAQVLQSDIFDALPQTARFDVVLFNLPFFQKPIEQRHELMACDPGGRILLRFLAGLGRHLADDGVAYLTYSNLADADLLTSAACAHRFALNYLAEDVEPKTAVKRYVIELTRLPL